MPYGKYLNRDHPDRTGRPSDRTPVHNKHVNFNPNRAYVDRAVSAYLKNGGKITKIELDETTYKKWMNGNEPPSEIDDFLNGVL